MSSPILIKSLNKTGNSVEYTVEYTLSDASVRTEPITLPAWISEDDLKAHLRNRYRQLNMPEVSHATLVNKPISLVDRDDIIIE